MTIYLGPVFRTSDAQREDGTGACDWPVGRPIAGA